MRMTDVFKDRYRNIFLVGFMGAGKTTVGRILAGLTGFKYLDADRLLEQNAGTTISNIFAEKGEDYFRDLETETLELIASREGQIVSTGGGAVQRDRNWAAMSGNGVSVYLKAEVETIWDRIKDDTTRPLLQVENPLDTARELLDKRTPMYERADIVVETDRLLPAQVAEKIISELS